MNWWIVVSALIGVAAGALLTAQKRTNRAKAPGANEMEEATTSSDPGLGLLRHISQGILLLDRGLHPLTANQAAHELLGLRKGPLPRHLPAPRLAAIAAQAVEQGGVAEDAVEVSFPARRDLHVRASPLDGGSRVLIVLQDISEEVRSRKARKEFVAHASHELKSPVASLKALAEAVVEAQSHDPEEAALLSRRLLEEADRLGELVVDLLDLSRLEDPEHMVREPLDLSSVLSSELEGVEGVAAEAGSLLKDAIEPGLEIRGDEQQIRLLIRNLLDNAIRYTPAGGTVTVQAETTGDRVTLSVEDTGIGIPREAQQRVFERFYRIDRARSRERGGSGLGLAIVKHVAEQHDATVSLRSEVGRGSTFTVSLPTGGPDLDKEPV